MLANDLISSSVRALLYIRKSSNAIEGTPETPSSLASHIDSNELPTPPTRKTLSTLMDPFKLSNIVFCGCLIPSIYIAIPFAELEPL